MLAPVLQALQERPVIAKKLQISRVPGPLPTWIMWKPNKYEF